MSKTLQIPSLVAILVNSVDAWIVGSAANPKVSTPRDWDVIVPLIHHKRLMELLQGRNVSINKFGGFKVKDQGVSIDVFIDDALKYLTHPKAKFLWNPQLGIRYSRETIPDLSVELQQRS